ncbi:unnamed protein product [Adineta steineri]|uniref:Peptidase C51 domain-containing protein n=2 Tax=Adineta steineri TaxID=433720 RepID=A0A820IYN7_9BILA|nr:unnamed protein product [Adineta steineri]
MPHGHVAVIIDVLPNSIRVAEENWDFFYWSRNYSREIPYDFINGNYYIRDNYTILGWILLDDKYNQTQPLDQSTINTIIQLNGSSPDFICRNNAIHHYFSTSYFFIFHLLLCLLFH